MKSCFGRRSGNYWEIISCRRGRELSFIGVIMVEGQIVSFSLSDIDRVLEELFESWLELFCYVLLEVE